MTGSKDTPKPPATSKKPEKKRAQPGDFDRQVEQIRKDINTVRSNLAAAEKALDLTSGVLGTDGDVEMKTDTNNTA